MLPLRISFWESYTLVRFSGQLGELYPIQTDASSTYVKMEVYLLLPLMCVGLGTTRINCILDNKYSSTKPKEKKDYDRFSPIMF